MKKIFHNNQVIITALAIMIAIAGYLNFSNNGTKDIGMSSEYYQAQNDKIVTEKPKSEDDSEKEIELTREDDITATGNVKSKDDEVSNVASAEEQGGEIGEAVLVNNNISLNYFYNVKLNREQSRARNKEELLDVVENNSISEEKKEAAVNKIIELTSNSERENASEMMLEAKGFKNSVVSIVDGKADVIIDTASITEEEVAQVVDIVNRKTGIEYENIVISPVNSKK